jgi:GT2 family glycosyltransferase
MGGALQEGRVGVVVPAHEDPTGLQRCLEALDLAAPDAPFVAVVDDASARPEQAALLDELEAGGRVRVLRNPRNLGFAGTSNRGLRAAAAAGCQEVLLLNQDAVLTRETLERLSSLLAAHPRAAAVGPRTLSLSEGPAGRRTLLFDGAFRRSLPLQQRIPGIGRPDPGGRPGPCRSDYLWGHALLLRVEALRQVGLFDAGFPFYYEDLDLCRRLSSAGWELWVCRDEVALHDQEDGSRARSSELWRWQKKLLGADLFHRKHYGPARAPLLNLLNALHESRHLVRHGHLRALLHLGRSYLHQARQAALASRPEQLEEAS